MHPSQKLLVVAVACMAAAHADTVTGVFTSDDDVLLVPFTVSTAGVVTLQTTSFAAANGFAPVLSLFDGGGLQSLLALDHNGGPGPGCGPRAVDSATGFCWDAYISMSLGTGSYLLALTQDDNLPNGPGFADGFARQGQGNFTGPNFIGGPGQFLLYDGTQRNGGYSISLTGTDPLPVAATPEPSGLALMALGCGLAGFWCLRRRGRPGSTR